MLSRVGLVLADCHSSAAVVEQEYRIASQRIRVIWDCVDLQRFSPAPRRWDLLESLGVPVGDNYRYLLTLGRIAQRTQYKGYDRLLDVLGTLREHNNIILLVAGDGD
jgi:phosphatidylinositol alpha-1,6-mannosyltransferase